MYIHKLLAVTLALVLTVGMVSPAMAGVATGFSDAYDPSNWNFSTDGDGTVDETNAPDSITLTGSDEGCILNGPVSAQEGSRDINQAADHLTGNFCGTFYEITIQCAGTVSFDWDWQTFDFLNSADPMGYLVNDDITPLTDTSSNIQSGSASVSVQAGDIFGFVTDSTDDIFGESVSVFSEFSGPVCIVGGELLPIDSTALILAGAQTNAVWIMSALAVIGSVAFGALYITSKKV